MQGILQENGVKVINSIIEDPSSSIGNYIWYNEMHQIDLTPQEQSGEAYSISAQKLNQSQQLQETQLSAGASSGAEHGNRNNLLQEILDELIIDGQCDHKDIHAFLLQLSAFIQKWQYVFVRITQSPGDTCIRIQDLVNQLHKPHLHLDLEQFYQVRSSLQLFLRQFSFEEVRQFCEVIQQYIVSKERVCFINAIDFLVLFCLEGKHVFSQHNQSNDKNQTIQPQKSTSKQSNRPGSGQKYAKSQTTSNQTINYRELCSGQNKNLPCLDILLAQTFDVQIMKLAAKQTPLISAEFYALLFCFMLTGQVVFFGAREVEAVMDETLNEILSLSAFSTARNFSDVLFQLTDTMKGVQVEYDNRPVRIRLPDKNLCKNFKKMFPIEDGEAIFEIVYNKLVLLLLKAQIYTGEEGLCSIIHCCYKVDGNATFQAQKWASNLHKGIQMRIRAELDHSQEMQESTNRVNISGEQEVLGVQHVPEDVLEPPSLASIMERHGQNENPTNNDKSQEHQVAMHQRYLPVQTQIEVFGRSFTSAEEAAQYLGDKIATSVRLKGVLEEYKRIIQEFKSNVVSVSDSEFKAQLSDASQSDDVTFARICSRVKRQTEAANALVTRLNVAATNREATVLDELEAAFKELQMPEFPGPIVDAFMQQLKQVLGRDVQAGEVSINDRAEFLQNYMQILNASVKEILMQVLENTETQMRLSLYQRLKTLIADAVVIPKDRFMELEKETIGILKDYELTHVPSSENTQNNDEQLLTHLIAYVKEKAIARGQSQEEAACSVVIGAILRAGLQVNYDEVMAQVI